MANHESERKNCLHGEALTACGFRNAAPSTDGPPSMSIEALIANNPDIIMILTSNPDTTFHESLIREFDKLPVLKAVEQKKVGVLYMENVMGTELPTASGIPFGKSYGHFCVSCENLVEA